MVRGQRWFVSPIAGCGLLAALAVTAAMAASLASSGWSLTALPRVGGATRLGAEARRVDGSFRIVRDGGYDGQFYWGIAIDPLATGAVHRMLDKPSYRYGHPLLGWLGWLLSAGRAKAAAGALAMLGLLSMVVAAATASWLGRRRGSSGWEGLFVALNPGLIGAAAHDLGEPLGAALLVGGLAGYVCRRWTLAWLCFACLPLAKEPLLLVVAAVAGWELLQGRRRAAAILASAALPAAAWWVYLRIDLGAWFTTGGTALAKPFSGWWGTLVGANGRFGVAPEVAKATLAALLLLFAFAAARAAVRRGPVELAYLALAAVAICLAPNATAAFETALRNTALLLVLVPFVLAASQLRPHRGGASRAALVASLALAGILASAAPAGAHAFLTRSEPAAGSSIQSPPTAVRLFFDEPVRPAQPMAVVRGGGQSVVAGAPYVPAGNPKEIVIPLRSPLGAGPYAVRWSEIDTADGHLISGAFIFSVGTGTPPIPAAISQGGGGTRPSAVVSRWLLLAGLLVAGGVAGFALLVRRRLERADAFVLAAALGVATLGAFVSVLLEPGTTGTRFGRWTLIGGAVAAAGALAALASLRAPRLRLPAAVAAIVLLALPTATGHASAAGVDHALSIPFDLVHFAAAAFWIGGVLVLGLLTPRALRGTLARRFSPFAVAAVVALASSGGVRAYGELSSVHQLWTTGYGRTLLVKTGVFAAVLVLGGLSRRAAQEGRLRIAGVRSELVLLAVVIGAVALLVNLRPGHAIAVAAASPTSVSRTVVYAGEDDKLAVGVALTPQSGNAVTLRATVLGFDGRVAGLDIRFGVESGGTTRSATATACGAGCYSATLPLAGRPQRVSARIAGPGRTPATLRFTGPAQWPAPQGLDIMRRAEITIDGLHSLVVHSHLASDSQHAVTTIYKMIAPDRLSYHNVGSSDSIIIGNRRWDRELGGRWVESPQIPSLRQPAPFWPPNIVDAHVLRTARVDGRSVWVVSFLDPGTPAWFTAWVDKSSYRTLRLEMVAAAHFMHDRDVSFNAPIRIEPPAR